MVREDTFGHLRKREVSQSAPKITAGIAKLEAARQNNGQRCAGNDAELAGTRDGASQRPAGHRHAHAALDDQGL
jgi:adenosine/AMP kinase